MKKILLFLLLLIGSISLSNDLNKYTSKRVFDKTMDFILKGNYTKYENDVEMIEILNSLSSKDKFYFGVIRGAIENNEYNVISVDEKKDKSVLTINAKYKTYDNVSEEDYKNIIKAMDLEMDKLEKDTNEIQVEARMRDIMYNGFKGKSKIETKIIKVYMINKNGLWTMADMEKNSEFIYTLMSVFEPIMRF